MLCTYHFSNYCFQHLFFFFFGLKKMGRKGDQCNSLPRHDHNNTLPTFYETPYFRSMWETHLFFRSIVYDENEIQEALTQWHIASYWDSKPSEHLNYLLLSFNLLFYIMKLISVLLAPPTTTPSCPHLLVSARHTRTILVGLSSLSLSHLVTLSRLINKPTETTTIPIYIYIYMNPTELVLTSWSINIFDHP